MMYFGKHKITEIFQKIQFQIRLIINIFDIYFCAESRKAC